MKNAEGKGVQLDQKEKNEILSSIKNNKNIAAIKNDPALAKLLERYQKEKQNLGNVQLVKLQKKSQEVQTTEYQMNTIRTVLSQQLL